MLKYVVHVNYSVEFEFDNGDEAIAFANMAMLHIAGKDEIEIRISKITDKDNKESEEN